MRAGALYLPVDHIVVAKYSLYEIAETFYGEGVNFIGFDEIHLRGRGKE